MELQKIDMRAVQEPVNAMPERGGRKLAAKAVREVYRVLRQALMKAVRWGLIVRNPTDHVDLPRGPGEASALGVKWFLEAARGSHFELVPAVMAGAVPARGGGPVKMVSDRLGHANASITLNVYVHSTPAQQERAAEVLGALVG